jgi:hypothetical protein
VQDADSGTQTTQTIQQYNTIRKLNVTQEEIKVFYNGTVKAPDFPPHGNCPHFLARSVALLCGNTTNFEELNFSQVSIPLYFTVEHVLGLTNLLDREVQTFSTRCKVRGFHGTNEP